LATNSNFDFFGKNQTPLQLAVIAALTSAFFFLLVIWGLNAIGWLTITLKGAFLIYLVAFLVDFVANYYFVRYYIFRRIKLIYKIIHRQKTSTDLKVENLNMQSNLIDEVEDEVNKWAEDREKELEELERMAKYRREYVGNISHELKTPIFSIQGFLHTLLDGGLNDPEINIKYLQRAAKNVERLQHIVEDLEVISKLESGEHLLEFREFDIRALCQEVFDELEMKAAERKISLKFKDGADQNYQIRADKEAIRQVLVNLVHNSIKYGKENGTTKISFYDLENFVLVEIGDNGLGIAEVHLNHVFDRFYRIDKSRSRDVGGTGLGLSIVKHIIEAHGQNINVRSSEGQGTTFGFTLEKAAGKFF
jgi:two-component system, OmpR family, phosphate regulon sensor histidine kinase PhoR